jgi:hypothetical protein
MQNHSSHGKLLTVRSVHRIFQESYYLAATTGLVVEDALIGSHATASRKSKGLLRDTCTKSNIRRHGPNEEYEQSEK